MTKTKKKNQKPIEIDAHFRYKCLSTKCGYDHWLSLKKTQTRNFKVVCDCGKIFKPKRIKKIKLIFKETTISKTNNQTTEQIPHKPKTVTVPVDIKNSCAKLLVGYGFTKEETLLLIDKAYTKHPVISGSLLVKYILQNLEELNVVN